MAGLLKPWNTPPSVPTFVTDTATPYGADVTSTSTKTGGAVCTWAWATEIRPAAAKVAVTSGRETAVERVGFIGQWGWLSDGLPTWADRETHRCQVHGTD